MTVIAFDEESCSGLAKGTGLTAIWVLIDAHGHILKEIGFAEGGKIAHKYPGDGAFGKYGVFDANIIEPKTSGDVSLEEFERAWTKVN